MSIKYTFAVEDNTLKVIARGKDDSLQEVKDYALAVIDEVVKEGCARVLCDERSLEYSISIIDTYSLAEEVSKYSTRAERLAIVCSDKFIKDGKFYETVASNRGLKVLVSSNYDLAVSWLNSK